MLLVIFTYKSRDLINDYPQPFKSDAVEHNQVQSGQRKLNTLIRTRRKSIIRFGKLFAKVCYFY